MQVFITAASGHIGAAVTRELLGAGRQVVGPARSDTSAAGLEALGAKVHRGSLDDLGSTRLDLAATAGPSTNKTFVYQKEGTAVTRHIKVPDTDHPITIDADTARVIVRVGDTVIADTSAALTLREARYPPVHYIPLCDVVPGMLRPSTSNSYCPYKGEATYYDVVMPEGNELVDAVWTYWAPYPAVDAIAGRVAFSTDRVQVEVETPVSQI